MIHLLDTTLEQHLRTIVPLPQAIEVSFATPDKKWGAARTRPTVNLFLWDVRREMRSAMSGYTEHRTTDGEIHRYAPDPEVALRYLDTAWAAEPRDEHQLLGSVLRGALLQEVIEEDAFPPGLPAVGPIHLEVSAGDGRPNDFWNSLDGQLKPNLELMVRMFVDLDQELEVGPPIEGMGVTVGRSAPAPAPARRTAGDGAGAAVPRRRRGSAVVMGAGADEPDGTG
jgi:hypothetical protein